MRCDDWSVFINDQDALQIAFTSKRQVRVNCMLHTYPREDAVSNVHAFKYIACLKVARPRGVDNDDDDLDFGDVIKNNIYSLYT